MSVGLMILCFLFVNRCLWFVRHCPHRERPGEVPVRAGGVRQVAIPQSADTVRQAPPTSTLPQDGLRPRHRAAIFCPLSRQDTDRNTHQGHATQWRIV